MTLLGHGKPEFKLWSPKSPLTENHTTKIPYYLFLQKQTLRKQCVDQCCPTELSAMVEMFYICTTGHLKCG